MEKYYRASHKQLDYIASLCAQLEITNPTLYSKTNMIQASKLINKLKRKLNKKLAEDRQLKLL